MRNSRTRAGAICFRAITPIRGTRPYSAWLANEREVFIGGVADMNIVGGNKFRGSTYPSQLPAEVRHRLREYTRAVGRKLGELGFRGIFGCDYIVDDAGGIFFIEVNPRKQGTTMEYCCTMEHVLPPGAPNMPELEIWAVLDGAFPPNMVEPDYDAAESGIVHWGTPSTTRSTAPACTPATGCRSGCPSASSSGGWWPSARAATSSSNTWGPTWTCCRAPSWAAWPQWAIRASTCWPP